jgi:NADPH:quinone reductase-like Zn-dependent oxidoreductase
VRLRPDLVLVALPPWPRLQRRDGRILLPPVCDQDRAGLVLQVGEAVTVVDVMDKVIFDTFAAEDVSIDGVRAVLVPEAALDAVVE